MMLEAVAGGVASQKPVTSNHINLNGIIPTRQVLK